MSQESLDAKDVITTESYTIDMYREDLARTEEALSNFKGESWKGRSRNFMDTLMGSITPEMREEIIENLKQNIATITSKIQELETGK